MPFMSSDNSGLARSSQKCSYRNPTGSSFVPLPNTEAYQSANGEIYEKSEARYDFKGMRNLFA